MSNGTVCLTCGREWIGFAECHCGGCCRHFTGLTAFDAHFGPEGQCQDPPLVWPQTERGSKRAGKPAFELKQRKHGPAWGCVGDSVTLPRFVAEKRLGAQA